MSNVTDVWLYQVCFFQDLNTQKKLVFGRGSTQSQDHAGGTYDVPPDSLVSWTAGEGDTPPHTLPPRHLRRLGCQAPLTQIPGYAYGYIRSRDQPGYNDLITIAAVQSVFVGL